MAQLQTFTGLRADGVASSRAAARPFAASSSSPAPRVGFSVVAQKRVVKKEQVILKADVPGLGAAGQLKTVPVGYWRNFLAPQGLAAHATGAVLARIQAEREAEERARLEERAKAQAMATALATIGKFVIKKKVGEKGQIFGSVTAQDVVDAIRLQTGRDLDKRDVALPNISETGTFDASIKLHPEVSGFFKVVVQKDTSA